MKLFPLLTLSWFTFISSAQNDDFDRQVFYKISIAATLTLNNEGSNSDNNSSWIVPNALFIKNTLGVAVNRRVSLGLNVELDLHGNPDLLFFPIYPDIRYNIIQKDDNGFVRFGYGKMFGKGKLNKGTLYKIGIGGEYFRDDLRRSALIGLEFTKKSYGTKEQNKLVSISIFFELIF